MSNYSRTDLANIGNSLVYYSDTSGATKMEYFGISSVPSAAITDKVRKVMRIEKDKTTDEFVQGKAIMFAGGNPETIYTATDLGTVKAYSYS